MLVKRTSHARAIFIGDTSIMMARLAELEIARQTLPNDQLGILRSKVISRGGRGAGKSRIQDLERAIDSTHGIFYAAANCAKLHPSPPLRDEKIAL